MNFLAHILLSGDDHRIAIGNYIGDFVKGKEIDSYPDKVRQGIRLHRLIDSFTDNHPTVLKSKKRLRPQFHHYAPVIADVYYDHFLARSWRDYHPQELKAYTTAFYQMIRQHLHWLPDKAKSMYEHMSRHDWLHGYRRIEGINRALTGMSFRTSFESGMENASLELEKNYSLYEGEFREFFPQLQKMCRTFLNQ